MNAIEATWTRLKKKVGHDLSYPGISLHLYLEGMLDMPRLVEDLDEEVLPLIAAEDFETRALYIDLLFRLDDVEQARQLWEEVAT